MSTERGIVTKVVDKYHLIATKNTWVVCISELRRDFSLGDLVSFSPYPVDLDLGEDLPKIGAADLEKIESIDEVEVTVDNRTNVRLTCKISNVLMPKLNSIWNFRTTFMELVHCRSSLANVSQNWMIGKRVVLEEEVYMEKSAWVVKEFLEQPKDYKQQVKGFIYDKNQSNNEVKVYVPGFPAYFTFITKSEPGRWVQFSVGGNGKPNSDLMGIPVEVFQTSESQLERKLKILMPCRRSSGKIAPLSTCFYDIVNDEHKVLEEYNLLKSFENKTLWLEFIPDFPKNVRFRISRSQPQLPMPPKPIETKEPKQQTSSRNNQRYELNNQHEAPNTQTPSRQTSDFNISVRVLKGGSRNLPAQSDALPRQINSHPNNYSSQRDPREYQDNRRNISWDNDLSRHRSKDSQRSPPRYSPEQQRYNRPEHAGPAPPIRVPDSRSSGSHRSGSTGDYHSSTTSLNSTSSSHQSRSPPRGGSDHRQSRHFHDRSPERRGEGRVEEKFMKAPRKGEGAKLREPIVYSSENPPTVEELMAENAQLKEEKEGLNLLIKIFGRTHFLIQDTINNQNAKHVFLNALRSSDVKLAEVVLEMIAAEVPTKHMSQDLLRSLGRL